MYIHLCSQILPSVFSIWRSFVLSKAHPFSEHWCPSATTYYLAPFVFHFPLPLQIIPCEIFTKHTKSNLEIHKSSLISCLTPSTYLISQVPLNWNHSCCPYLLPLLPPLFWTYSPQNIISTIPWKLLLLSFSGLQVCSSFLRVYPRLPISNHNFLKLFLHLNSTAYTFLPPWLLSYLPDLLMSQCFKHQ